MIGYMIFLRMIVDWGPELSGHQVQKPRKLIIRWEGEGGRMVWVGMGGGKNYMLALRKNNELNRK